MATMYRPRHRWTESDDIVALYLSRHGSRLLPLRQAGIAKVLGMPESSLMMRQSNFAHLDGREGLDHAAELSRGVHQHYGKLNEPQLRGLVLEILNPAKAGA